MKWYYYIPFVSWIMDIRWKWINIRKMRQQLLKSLLYEKDYYQQQES